MKLLEKLDYLVLLILRERLETRALGARFSAVMKNRFDDRGQVASMAIRRGVPDILKFSRDELIDGNAVLGEVFVAEERILSVADDMPFQIRVGSHDRAANSFCLRPSVRIWSARPRCATVRAVPRKRHY